VNKDLYIRGFGEDAFVRMDIFPTFINHIAMAASSTACDDAGKLTGKQTGIFFICYSPIS